MSTGTTPQFAYRAAHRSGILETGTVRAESAEAAITPYVIYSDDDMQEAAEELRARRNMRRALGKRDPLIDPAAPADSARTPAAQPGQPVPPPQP